MTDFTHLGTFTYVPPSPHDLLVAVHALIVEHPERHDQKNWIRNAFTSGVVSDSKMGELRQFAFKFLPEEPKDEDNPVCGTRACVAGWAVILGDDPGVKAYGSDLVRLPDGTTERYSVRAAKLLGLTYDQSAYLFSSDRTRSEVIEGLSRLIEDPSDKIWLSSTVSLTVSVTDPSGTVIYTTDVNVDPDPDDTYHEVDEALEVAYQRH